MIRSETAGILIEPIQGEGGVRVVPSQCLRGLRDLCDQHGLLLIFDEVQTGIGRTGAFFSYERSGIAPDIMALAKGIGGGFPMGACLATIEAGKGMVAGSHGSTFGGNPLAMAVGNAVLDLVLAEGFLQQVGLLSLIARQRLAEIKDMYPNVIDAVRGEGLMLGIKTHVANSEVVSALLRQNMLAVGAGDNVVRLLPPLNIDEATLSEGLNRIERACADIDADIKAKLIGGTKA